MDYDNTIITLETLIQDLIAVRDRAMELKVQNDEEDAAAYASERAQDIIGWTRWE